MEAGRLVRETVLRNEKEVEPTRRRFARTRAAGSEAGDSDVHVPGRRRALRPENETAGGLRVAWRPGWPEAVWACFVAVALAVMLAVPDAQPIAFNLIWISLTIVFAYRQWPRRAALLAVLGIAVLTGAAAFISRDSTETTVAELADVPAVALLLMLLVSQARQRLDVLGKLARAAEREREFVRDASHQLRTPITIASGHAELIIHENPDSTAARDAGIVLAELHRLQQMSDRLLILASADHPGFLMLAPASLQELIETAAARWTPVADREWVVDVRADGTVLVDRGRIDAALDALIENGIKATSDGDAIALGAEDHGGVPVLSVSDRGIGVDLEHRERIFERFARIRPAGGSGRGGTGLGLPTVRAIAVAHGGAAELVPDPDGWTRFELRLGRFEAGRPAALAPARGPRSLSR